MLIIFHNLTYLKKNKRLLYAKRALIPWEPWLAPMSCDLYAKCVISFHLELEKTINLIANNDPGGNWPNCATSLQIIGNVLFALNHKTNEDLR